MEELKDVRIGNEREIVADGRTEQNHARIAAENNLGVLSVIASLRTVVLIMELVCAVSYD